MENNINLDTWRIARAKHHREEDALIDALCDMLLQAQGRIKELEAQVKPDFVPMAESLPVPTP